MVIYVEIDVYRIKPHYKFLVVASDGVWTLMKNEEVAKIVFRSYDKNDPQAAANAVVHESYLRWTKTDTCVDDITCIVVFLG